MKQLYDYSQLQAVLKGFDYLSDARVAMYNKHKEDLRLLKKCIKEILVRKHMTVCSVPVKKEAILRTAIL